VLRAKGCDAGSPATLAIQSTSTATPLAGRGSLHRSECRCRGCTRSFESLSRDLLSLPTLAKATATKEAGVPNLLFHDLRRTAARALCHAGVDEGVLLKIGDWRTRNVFERYAIVAQSDIKDAMAKLERQKTENSHSLATEAPEAVQSEQVDKEPKIN
jgi:hypothetical protein